MMANPNKKSLIHILNTYSNCTVEDFKKKYQHVSRNASIISDNEEFNRINNFVNCVKTSKDFFEKYAKAYGLEKELRVLQIDYQICKVLIKNTLEAKQKIIELAKMNNDLTQKIAEAERKVKEAERKVKEAERKLKKRQPVQPTPAPTPVQPTPAPTPVQPTPAPTPVQPTPAPTPVQPTPAPTPVQEPTTVEVVAARNSIFKRTFGV